MSKAFALLKKYWFAVVTPIFIAIIIFRYIPFARNWSLFWELVFIGIGIALLSRYSKSPAKILTARNGVVALSLLFGYKLLFGIIFPPLPKFEKAVGQKTNKLDDTLEKATNSISLEKLAALTAPSKDEVELKRVMSLPQCSGQGEIPLNPTKGVSQITVEMQRECWSGFINAPADYSWHYLATVNKSLYIWFQADAEPILIPAGEKNRYFATKRAIFRVLGEGPIIVTVSK